jgi:3',5'-nucleoside bisphosphate phosphatase
MFMRGDLQVHSTASDGKLSPWEVVKEASNRGINIIALTDHRTTNGIAEAASAGRKYGVAVIPAIEISTRYKGKSVHLLGYFTDTGFTHGTFQEILRLLRAKKVKEAKTILSNFMYVDPYKESLSVYEGINLLRLFGASVVLAHPTRIDRRFLPEVLSLPFDGIEAKYCRNSASDTSFYTQIANAHFSFYTGGSDFHRYGRGCLIGGAYLNDQEMRSFLQNSGALVFY